MTMRAHLQPVDIDDLEDYPIDPAARLDSHGFVPWEFRRWLSSEMRWSGTHECKSMWFDLVMLAHSETPVGTLPTSPKRLSRMIQPVVDAEHFAALCKLQFGPLYGWHPCRCGEDIRLMHPVVTRIVKSAFASRANNAARVEAASQARKLARLTEDIGQLAPDLAQDSRKVRYISGVIDDLVAQRGGVRRTAEDLHAGIQACLAETRKGRWPAKPQS